MVEHTQTIRRIIWVCLAILWGKHLNACIGHKILLNLQYENSLFTVSFIEVYSERC